uniref:Uncharacterized protein n=1 Tax=Sphaerodactylus townsendi TaxID=933632 RepID=A0ACB8GD08_9SAUR
MNECVIPPFASAVIQLLEKLANTSLDEKKVLLLGVEGPLEVSLQCLLQRKGVMTMSCPWKMKQLQATLHDADVVIVGSTKPKEIPVTWMSEMTAVNCSRDFLDGWYSYDEQPLKDSDQIPGEVVDQLAMAIFLQNLVKISERWIHAQQCKKWNLRCLKLQPCSPVPSFSAYHIINEGTL